MNEKTAFEQAADIEAATPINSPPAPASELPSGLIAGGEGVKLEQGCYAVWRGYWTDARFVGETSFRGTFDGDFYLRLPDDPRLPLPDASEVERLKSALEAAEGALKRQLERSEYWRQQSEQREAWLKTSDQRAEAAEQRLAEVRAEVADLRSSLEIPAGACGP